MLYVLPSTASDRSAPTLFFQTSFCYNKEALNTQSEKLNRKFWSKQFYAKNTTFTKALDNGVF